MGAEAEPPLLRLVGVAVARGGVPLLEGVGFALAPGEVLALRGPNGIGKTSLLRTVAGLQSPLAGSVDGAEAAYAAHADGVKAQLTVAENLSFWLDVFGGEGIGPALDAFDLVGLAERPARDLSAGQRRRLALARLLVAGRRLWLLDEPTVSLDANSTRLLMAALDAHRAAGGAALIATHAPLDGVPSLDLAPHRASLPALEDW